MKTQLTIIKPYTNKVLSFKVMEDADANADLNDIIIRDHHTVWGILQEALLKHPDVLMAATKEEHPQTNCIYISIKLHSAAIKTARDVLFEVLREQISAIESLRRAFDNKLELVSL